MKRFEAARGRDWPRKIIHIDMDAFFAAIEQRDHPSYRGQPVVVGGDPKSRGVVSTCSYEARKFGIHSAMPSARAYRLCPQAVFIRPRFQVYEQISEIIHSILRSYTSAVEMASLDEAYLDASQAKFGMEDPVVMARLIKQHIFAVTRLTASAGVAPNMFLAKIASDFKKPDGLTVIRPDEVDKFLEDLPVRKIPGVGPVTEKALRSMKIETCGQLAGVSFADLSRRFGKTGHFLYERAHGRDSREVEPCGEPKQLSCEETFERDRRDVPWMKEKLAQFAREIFHVLSERGRVGQTVTLKVKYYDFEQVTRSRTLPHPPADWQEIWQVACGLLTAKTKAGEKSVRLLGLGISGLRPAAEVTKIETPDLFEGME